MSKGLLNSFSSRKATQYDKTEFKNGSWVSVHEKEKNSLSFTLFCIFLYMRQEQGQVQEEQEVKEVQTDRFCLKRKILRLCDSIV